MSGAPSIKATMLRLSKRLLCPVVDGLPIKMH
jgi:hypothetical protein